MFLCLCVPAVCAYMAVPPAWVLTEGYAWECQTQEGGWGLDAIVRENNWKLRGIVNGIDYSEWSPVNDMYLTADGYCQYDLDTLEQGKKQCKVRWLAGRKGVGDGVLVCDAPTRQRHEGSGGVQDAPEEVKMCPQRAVVSCTLHHYGCPIQGSMQPDLRWVAFNMPVCSICTIKDPPDSPLPGPYTPLHTS